MTAVKSISPGCSLPVTKLPPIQYADTTNPCFACSPAKTSRSSIRLWRVARSGRRKTFSNSARVHDHLPGGRVLRRSGPGRKGGRGTSCGIPGPGMGYIIYDETDDETQSVMRVSCAEGEWASVSVVEWSRLGSETVDDGSGRSPAMDFQTRRHPPRPDIDTEWRDSPRGTWRHPCWCARRPSSGEQVRPAVARSCRCAGWSPVW